MSLFRQIWLVVIAATLLAFTGSFVASMLTARTYLEQQLATKNNDNASTLALSMSQQAKDPVTVELQLAAVFDSGQYATVRLIDPEGKTVVERSSPPEAGRVPEWFVRIFPIESRAGTAQVSNGWSQFGTIELVSHSHFAYEELWQGGIRLLVWFLVGGIVLGLLGMRFLSRIKRPLDAVVGQAQAISERRFVSIPEPSVPELKSVARAMNAMVERIKAMFAEEAQRLEQVRREATLDSLTGLSNRAFFLNRLDYALKADDAPELGSVLILRVGDLAGINKRSGRETADEVLRRVAHAFSNITDDNLYYTGARLNGADFALLLPSEEDPAQYAEMLMQVLRDLAAAGLIDGHPIGHVATVVYRHGQEIGQVMALLDATLATAENESQIGWCSASGECSSNASSNADWKKLIETAITTQRLKLIEFPVAGNDGQLLHLECPLRLQTADGGEWLAAGRFMPMASRLSLTSELDLAAARLALKRLAQGDKAVAVNLSGESIMHSAFREKLEAMLREHRDLAPNLWLEVSEIGAFQHFDAFRAFCNTLRPYGCRLGIEHFGRQFSEIGKLHDIGLDYLKVDASFIRSIEREEGNQTFLKGLCSIAHNLGLTVIAEGVSTPSEIELLPQIGFDGATGPAVSTGNQ